MIWKQWLKITRGRKNRAIFAALSLLLISCGSRKVDTEYNIDRNLMERMERMIEETIDRKSVEVQKRWLMADVSVIRREFDTSAPGSPVKAETLYDITVRAKDNTAIIDTMVVKKTESDSLSVKDDIKVIDKEKTLRSGFSWRISLVIMIVLGLFICLFGFRFFKRM